MEDNIETSIRFAIQREILISLHKNEFISEQELIKALNTLKKKNKCKLIVTSSTI